MTRAELEAAIRGQVNSIANSGRTQRDRAVLARELEQRVTMLMASAEAYAAVQVREETATLTDRHATLAAAEIAARQLS